MECWGSTTMEKNNKVCWLCWCSLSFFYTAPYSLSLFCHKRPTHEKIQIFRAIVHCVWSFLTPIQFSNELYNELHFSFNITAVCSISLGNLPCDLKKFWLISIQTNDYKKSKGKSKSDCVIESRTWSGRFREKGGSRLEHSRINLMRTSMIITGKKLAENTGMFR